MDAMAIIGARQTLRGVQEIRELWPDRRLDLLAVLPTAVNAATNATRAAFDVLEQDGEMRERLYRPGIRQCIDVTYALTQRQTIWEYAARSRAAEDYSAFVRFVAERWRRREDGRDAAADPQPVETLSTRV
jgi:cellulose biosynthesis protein BcsQ